MLDWVSHNRGFSTSLVTLVRNAGGGWPNHNKIKGKLLNGTFQYPFRAGYLFAPDNLPLFDDSLSEAFVIFRQLSGNFDWHKIRIISRRA